MLGAAVAERKRYCILLLALIPILVASLSFSCAKPYWIVDSEPEQEPWEPDYDDLDVPRGKSSSIGRPNNGRLKNGVPLLPRDGIRLNNQKRTYGTDETVALMNMAIDKMIEKYPDTCDMFIGDISTKHGGKLSPHISHQSGRDIDTSLYAKGNRFIYFENMNRNNLDLEKTWYFMETLMLTGRVQMILLDYELQKLFYEYLRPYYSKRKLAYYMQYPRPKGERGGIIRHAPRHGNHLHIRFKCPEGDKYCEDW